MPDSMRSSRSVARGSIAPPACCWTIPVKPKTSPSKSSSRTGVAGRDLRADPAPLPGSPACSCESAPGIDGGSGGDSGDRDRSRSSNPSCPKTRRPQRPMTSAQAPGGLGLAIRRRDERARDCRVLADSASHREIPDSLCAGSRCPSLAKGGG